MEKLKHSLLMQMASLITLLFIFAIILNGILIYKNEYSLFGETTYDNGISMISYVKTLMQEYQSLPWLIEYWSTHTDSMDPDIPTEEELPEWRRKHKEWTINDAKLITQEEAEAMSEEDQRLFAEYCYVQIQLVYNRLIDSFFTGSLQCIKPYNDDEYLVIFKGWVSKEKDIAYLKYLGIPREHWKPYEQYARPSLGLRVPLNPDSRKNYDLTYKTGKVQKAYDTMEFYGVKYMQCYIPIISNGKVIAMITGSLTENSFLDYLWSKLMSVETLNIVIHMLIAMLLLLQINLIAIRPLRSVRRSLNDYTRNHDSKKAIQQLSGVKPINEVGFVAEDIVGLAHTMDGYIDNIVKMTGDRERITAELSVATRIQQGLLPKEFPQHEKFSVYASMTPAKEVGGDLYDFFPIGDGKFGLVIADVSGKGIPAAFLMAIARTMIHNNMIGGKLSPAETLQTVNRGLCEDNTEMMFVTAWVAVFDPKTYKLTCVNAGHEYPCICSAGGKYEIYNDDDHDVPLGVYDEATFREYEILLQPKASLFVYSDGLPEAMNDKMEQFGEERMIEELNAATEKDPKSLLKHMEQSVDRFVGEKERFDDLTMLCISCR